MYLNQNGNFGSSQEMALKGAGLSIGATVLNMGPQESAFLSAVLHYFQMQPILFTFPLSMSRVVAHFKALFNQHKVQ